MRVLLVDDSALARLAMKRIFEETEITALADFELIEATNGLEALEKHRTLLPDIIFLDITMPHLDGVATLSTLRLTDTKVKIIMITALGSHPSVISHCLKIGADDIVAKPADKIVLLKILQRIMADKQEQEASL